MPQQQQGPKVDPWNHGDPWSNVTEHNVPGGHWQSNGNGKFITYYTTVFDPKDVEKLPKNDGRNTELNAWYKRVMDYMISKAPDVVHLPKWAEK